MAHGPVLQGFSFFPRGGSAQVVRYLTAALVQAGWTPRIVTGSVGGTGNPGHAATFFAGLPVSAADFTPALDAWLRGEDPLDQPVPLHASYEDKPGAPDRVLAGVSPELGARQVDSGGACWSGYAHLPRWFSTSTTSRHCTMPRRVSGLMCR